MNTTAPAPDSGAPQPAETPLWLSRLWRGDIPLAPAYWGFGIGGRIGFALVLLAISSSPNAQTPIGVILGFLVFFAFLFYGGVVLVGIWRSAGRYRGRPAWRTLAQATVVFGWFDWLTGVSALVELGERMI
jgi:hypothetical protein